MTRQLTWRPYTDAIFGPAYSLDGLPDGSSAFARRYGGARGKGAPRYIANAFIAGIYMSHCAGTVDAAMKHLNREIDRRSIGLFGVDDLVITKESPTPKYFWSYQSDSPTPTVDQLPAGTFAGTQAEFEKLSPGMRREILRTAIKRAKRAKPREVI